MFPEISADSVPFVSTEQMVEVDRAMVDDFRILLIQMMENAGRNLAHVARARFLRGSPRGRRVAVFAGVGGNGGGALVAARRLHNWGAQVCVFVTKNDASFTEVPYHQLRVIRRMGIPVTQGVPATEPAFDLLVDGIIGYSLKGAPHDVAADMIGWINRSGSSVLSLDGPSGVDAATGRAFDPAVRATATMTLALPKEGLRVPSVRDHVGELYLADISVPPELYSEPALKLDVGPLFERSDIVRLV